MNHIVTTGIVLSRLNYGEADKIITILTPDHGKLRVMARGVRKSTSKLAGGIELFSISSITYIPGKRDISTLVSTRLVTNYSHIIEDINRTMAAYDILKLLNKATQDECEGEYYHLLMLALVQLNEVSIDPKITLTWFYMQLLDLLGQRPNLTKSSEGEVLDPNGAFIFDFEKIGFIERAGGTYNANDIKLMRLLLKENPQKLVVIKDVMSVIGKLEPLLKQLTQQFVQ